MVSGDVAEHGHIRVHCFIGAYDDSSLLTALVLVQREGERVEGRGIGWRE